jgi:hypothetical protein
MNNKILKLIKEMNLAIFNENELVDKDIVVLYPGKFQPMAIYHREEYDRICRKFDKDNVIIVTNDITDPIEKPLTYDEKFAIMRRHNVKHIMQSNTPFHATNVIEQFDGDATVVIYALDKDDVSKLKDYKKLMRWNGTSQLPYKDIQNPYVYYMVVNHVRYDIPSFGEMGSKSIFAALADRSAKLAELKSRFISIFGWFDVEIFNMVVSKFNTKRGKMKESKKDKNGLRPLHMITKKFWNKVYKEIIK